MKNKLTVVTNHQAAQPRWPFDHHRLDAYHVAMEALVKGMGIINRLPRGYGKLKDQTSRALQGAFTQTTEAAARTGADRLARYRSARAEAGEAAGLFEAFEQLRLADAAEVDEVLELLWRLSAMLCRLAQLKR
jgi:hypothetical protein